MSRSSSTVSKVSLLKGCTNLVSLSLDGDGWYDFDFEGSDITDFENLHDETFPDTVAWLKKCNKLRILSFVDFFAAPALILPILLEDSIHLTSLEYDGFRMPDVEKFYRALGNQTSLRSLWLRGYAHDYALEADVLIESLSNLVNLTDLYLSEISDSFTDRHIAQLASRLSKLEVWTTGGYGLTDAIWGEVAALKMLRRLDIDGLIFFTVDGVLDFINKLGPGNDGLVLSVISTNRGSNISSTDRALIQLKIARKVKGKFTFTLGEGDYWHDWFEIVIMLISPGPQICSFDSECDCDGRY